MMGRRGRDEAKLFYEFRLDDRIPNNHLLRRIDVFVTAALADLHKELEPYYAVGPRLDCGLIAAARSGGLVISKVIQSKCKISGEREDDESLADDQR
jgi:hypothetical protein